MNQRLVSEYLAKVEQWPWERIGQFSLIGLLCFLLALMPFQPGFVLDEVHLLFYTFLLFLACLYRPTWSFLLLTALLPLETTNLLPVHLGIDLRPYQLLTVTLALALAVRLMTKKINWPLFTLTRIDWCVALLGVGSLLAIVGALDPAKATKSTLIFVSFAGLYGIMRYFLSQTALRSQSILALSVGTGVVFLVALWQNIASLGGWTTHMVMDGRPNSTFFEADWLGLFSALIVLLSTAGIWYSFKKKYHRRQPFGFIALVVMLFVSWMVLVLTVARSAWLATLVGLIILFLGGLYSVRAGWWRRKLLLITSTVVILTAISAVVVVTTTGLTRFDISQRLSSTATGEQLITVACTTETVLPETISSLEMLASYGCQHIRLEEKEILRESGMSIQEVKRVDPNFNTRSEIYKKTFTLIQSHSLLGIGGGNSALVLGTDAQGASLNASNLFLETWLSNGLLGLLALLAIFGILLVRFLDECRRGSEKHLLGLALLLALITFNLFNAGMLLGIFFGLLAYLATLAEESGHMIKLETDFKVL
ncbi:MAG: O-antigen ligase family protein [Patescibacteria group bacterium]|mgnify:CR=1 FL=1